MYGAAVAPDYHEETGYSKVVHTSTDFRTPLNLFALPGCNNSDVAKYSFDATGPCGKRHVSRIV